MSRWTLGSRIALTAVICAGCGGPNATGRPTANGPSTAPGRSVAVSTPGPSAGPTTEPGPTIPGALPLRTRVEINSPIVDRQGVPADLAGAYWWTGADAGQLGSTAQIGVPAGERIVAAADGLVVAVRNDGGRTWSLVVRDFARGFVVREVRTAVILPTAAIVGRRIFWSGMDPGTDDVAGQFVDGGVWAVDIGPGEPAFAIIPGGDVVSSLGSPARGLFGVSPTRRTMTSLMGGFGGSFTDVIDVEASTLRHRLLDTWAWAITDAAYVTWDSPPTDAPATGHGITAFDLATQAVLWHFPDPADVDRFVPSRIEALPSHILIEYAWQTGDEVESIVALLDPETGMQRILLRAPQEPAEADLHLVPYVSTDRHIALAAGDSSIESLVWSGAPISLLDVETGVITPDAFRIDTPWRCNDEYCLRG